ncbi:uncharacterized protein LOC131804283 [Musca domestica]|uniref:Uncharacterized protein LOC131804283 n=1 Tax=Musca domestica TaxID=7370 RepID=A0ABM3VAS6_MUSDO|nr:uncharacterized protein LOC131804283 [Musca domestica]
MHSLIDTNKGSGNLHKDHLEDLEEMVNNNNLDHIMESGDSIRIASSGMKNNKIFFKLPAHANTAALKGIIEKIKPPWENGSLELVRWNEIPRLTKTTVYVRGFGSKFGKERMLEVFGMQNKTLDVKRWEVFHREQKEDGTLLVIGVDDLSMASLTKTKGMVFYVSNAVKFKNNKVRIGDEDTKCSSEEEKEDPPSNTEQGVGDNITDSQEARLLEDQ